jgi:hypothetical protein
MKVHHRTDSRWSCWKQACRYLAKDIGTSQSPKSTRQRGNRCAPAALRPLRSVQSASHSSLIGSTPLGCVYRTPLRAAAKTPGAYRGLLGSVSPFLGQQRRMETGHKATFPEFLRTSEMSQCDHFELQRSPILKQGGQKGKQHTDNRFHASGFTSPARMTGNSRLTTSSEKVNNIKVYAFSGRTGGGVLGMEHSSTRLTNRQVLDAELNLSPRHFWYVSNSIPWKT